LVDSRLGRKGTMALATVGTSIALFVSTLFSGSGAVFGNCIASFLQNIMWGVIYAYTPEVFRPSCRGTAVGIAASLSRIFGSTAPVVAGALFNINSNLPLIVSSMSILIASFCMILLPIETRGLDRF
jgi:MFS family permease